jgi:hypothetical protein
MIVTCFGFMMIHEVSCFVVICVWLVVEIWFVNGDWRWAGVRLNMVIVW